MARPLVLTDPAAASPVGSALLAWLLLGALLRTFGIEYAEYRDRTQHLVPWVR